MTFVLRIEHPVPDYDAWKESFDNDPLDRRGSGVRDYRVMRADGEPNYVMIDLDFDSHGEADTMRGKLLQLWGRVAGEGLIGDQNARIAEVVESNEL